MPLNKPKSHPPPPPPPSNKAPRPRIASREPPRLVSHCAPTRSPRTKSFESIGYHGEKFTILYLYLILFLWSLTRHRPPTPLLLKFEISPFKTLAKDWKSLELILDPPTSLGFGLFFVSCPVFGSLLLPPCLFYFQKNLFSKVLWRVVIQEESSQILLSPISLNHPFRPYLSISLFSLPLSRLAFMRNIPALVTLRRVAISEWRVWVLLSPQGLKHPIRLMFCSPACPPPIPPLCPLENLSSPAKSSMIFEENGRDSTSPSRLGIGSFPRYCLCPFLLLFQKLKSPFKTHSSLSN